MRWMGGALLGVAVLLTAAPATANRLLGLAQLGGGQGCIAQPEEEAEAIGGCGRGRGLIDATAVAISPDGGSAYVAASQLAPTRRLLVLRHRPAPARQRPVGRP